MAEPDVAASGQVAREFKIGEDAKDRSGGMRDECHVGFDEDVGPGLEPPGARVGGAVVLVVTSSSG